MSKDRKKLWIPEIQLESRKIFKKVNVNVNVSLGSLAGFIKLELLEAATGIVKECYEFPNIILTAGLDAMFIDDSQIFGTKLSDLLNSLTIGTGSTVPDPSDLHLDELVASTTSDGGIPQTGGYQTGSGGGPFDLGNPYHFVVTTRVFVENQANFPTLSELGWRSTSTPEFQFTRALIKDVDGVPITIAKTDQDQLRITYELRFYPPTSQFSGSFILGDSETSHSFTGSAVDIDTVVAGKGWGFTAAGGGTKGLFFGFGNWQGQSFKGQAATPYASASLPGNPTGTILQWDGWLGADTSDANMSESLFSYRSGSLEQTKEAVWEPSRANFGPGGIQGMTFDYVKGGAIFAMYFTPAIEKTDVQRLRFIYTATVTASVTSSA